MRARILDFAVSGYLLGISTARKQEQKDTEELEMYKKLEKWIFQNVGSFKIEDDLEDTTMSLDF